MSDENLLTSPVGQIWFMAVNQPVTNSRTGKSKREICLLLDSKADASFIKEIAKVNAGIPVTAATYRGTDGKLKAILETGKTKISAGTQFEVPVYDKNGQKMEENPSFYPGSTGMAQMIV